MNVIRYFSRVVQFNRHVEFDDAPTTQFEAGSKRRGPGGVSWSRFRAGLRVPVLTRVGCCQFEFHGGSMAQIGAERS